MKGLLLLVPPPRSGGYDVYAHVFYVVMCYMSITCICLLYVGICYMSMICYMSVLCLVLGGVVRVRLYIIYAHLCNHISLQSGGGTWGTGLYTVRGVGSGRSMHSWR